MGYTVVALEDKVMEMYPDISRYGIALNVVFSEEKNAYIAVFRKDGKELTTHIEKKDADECMDGIKCVSLGVQIEQFIKNFQERR